MISSLLRWLSFPKRLALLALALLTIGVLWYRMSASFQATNYYAQRLEQKLQERELQWTSLIQDTQLLEALSTRNYAPDKLRSLDYAHLGFGFYLYRTTGQESELYFWNTQKVIPPELASDNTQHIQGVHLKNGFYVLATHRMRYNDQTYIYKALFPVLQEYFVAIDNLPTKFPDFKEAIRYITIQDTPSQDGVHARNGKAIFYVRASGKPYEGLHFGLLVCLIGLILLWILLHRFVAYLLDRAFFWRGFFCLLSGVIITRFLFLLVPIFFHLQHWSLFSSELFSIGVGCRSIFDLFIESLGLLWVAFFLHKNFSRLDASITRRTSRTWIIALVAILLLVMMTFGLAHLLQRMVAESNISYNVTNFESVGVYSFFGFFILGILAFFYYLCSYIFLQMLQPYFPYASPLMYLGIAIAGLFLLSFTKNPDFVALNMTALVWLLIIMALLQTPFLGWKSHQIRHLHLLYWLLILSLSMAGIMLLANNSKTLEQKKHFAEKLAQQADPKTYKKDVLGLALFRQRRASLIEGFDTDYSYALYAKGQLVDYYNSYPFPATLSGKQVPVLSLEERAVDDVTELWYRKSHDKVVVIVQKNKGGIAYLTLFAYLFSTFLLIALCYGIIEQLRRARSRKLGLRQMLQLNIRSQINGTMIFVMVLSLVLMGSITIFFFISRYQKTQQETLSRTMQIIVRQIQQKVVQHGVFNDGISMYEDGVNVALERIVMETSEFHETDLNLYDASGNLRISSRPLIYNKGVISNKMDPMAFHQLSDLHAVQWIEEEEIGAIRYMSLYHAIRLEDGSIFGYLNMPTYSAADELKQEISNFLVTLINLNAFIFLIAGAIALLITNRITSSFTLIGQKMRAVQLGKPNQKIDWPQDDEIGVLVKEYNRMLLQLEKSAVLLAKSEREEAWRQMARQVAHEIKNPLTPMKLSIQHLQKSVEQGDAHIEEKTKRVAQTLVEQIDHLSRIAADFSQFANMDSAQLTRFDFHEIAVAMQTLYGMQEELFFEWKRVDVPVMLFADKTQLNRLLTNLLKNAVEARSGNGAFQIHVVEMIEDDHLVLQVQDNGSGIPEAMRAKIFSPNFTTKSSGTGLGLAMCKSIVEQAHGKIWFESEEGKGTTFFVRLPLASS